MFDTHLVREDDDGKWTVGRKCAVKRINVCYVQMLRRAFGATLESVSILFITNGRNIETYVAMV